MNNAPALVKTLIVYALLVPLAIFIGYLLTDPTQLLGYNSSAMAFIGILILVMISPLLLRWHHPLLVVSWNASVVLFFLPGRPDLWLGMAVLSLSLLLMQRTLGGIKRILSVPQITWALLFMAGVVIFTARLRGLGLRSMGSDVYGGRHYIYFLGAIMGYFAVSGLRIPPERANLYIGLFFLGSLATIIGDLLPIVPGFLHFIFLFFPPNPYYFWNEGAGIQGIRLGSAWPAGFGVFSYMLAKYGVRGIFLAGKRWRAVLFTLAVLYSLFGGFRGATVLAAFIFACQFYLEGMHRTKLLPIFAFLSLSMMVVLVPLTPHLPYSVQRVLTVLPIKTTGMAQKEAEGSSRWRFDMWKALLPQVPQYLLLGKGYGVSAVDFNLLTGSDAAIHTSAGFEQNQYMALAGAYHSGPLSVILIFGIWGCLAVIWMWVAGMWVLICNYRYGDPALRTTNLFLLVAFGARILFFLFIFGSIESDMLYFGGWLALSVALNGGVCQPTPFPSPAADKYPAFAGVRSHLQPTFRRPPARV